VTATRGRLVAFYPFVGGIRLGAESGDAARPGEQAAPGKAVKRAVLHSVEARGIGNSAGVATEEGHMARGQTSDRQRGRNSRKWKRRLFRQLLRPHTAKLFIDIGKVIVAIVRLFSD
jgi:hypothetical protein